MPFTALARANVVQNIVQFTAGSAATPAVSFLTHPSSGLFISGGQDSVGISVGGVEKATVSSSGVLINGNLTSSSTFIGSTFTGTFVGDGSQLTGLATPMSISNVQITDSSWNVVDDLAISTSGGYCVVNGSGFAPGCLVSVGTDFASSTSYVSSTQLKAQLPSKASGTYSVTVIRGDSAMASLPMGITVSSVPAWGTASDLGNVNKNESFTRALAATESNGSSIVYTVDAGSSLPPGVSLSSGGTLSGTIVTDIANTTLYSFLIQATDTQLQNTSRLFALNAVEVTLSTIIYSQSSVYSTNQPATQQYMRDGSFTSSTVQTGTNSGGAQWIMMDFGSQYEIKRVAVGCDFNSILVGGWGKAYTENRNVQYSTDGSTWTFLFNTGTFTTGIQYYTVNVTARYVRILNLNDGYVAVTEFDAFLK